jgi:hypothetical protein
MQANFVPFAFGGIISAVITHDNGTIPILHAIVYPIKVVSGTQDIF